MSWRPTRLHHSGFASINLEFCAERGFALLLSLAILAGLSLLAILAANSMLHQQQMAANHADNQLARLSARTAVGTGEQFLLGLEGHARTENCQSDCFTEAMDFEIHSGNAFSQPPEFQTDNWWLMWGYPKLDSQDVDSSTETNWGLPGRLPPQFLIEELKFQSIDVLEASGGAPTINGVGYYRVMGRGTGAGANTTRVAESILARPWMSGNSQDGSNILDCVAYMDWFDCGRMAYRELR